MADACESFLALTSSTRYNCGTIARVTQLCIQFLKSKRQVIYGGQAIHFALMRKGRALYNEAEIPDFDVQTPTNFTDAIEFSNMLLNEGMNEISVIPAMHAQTVRVRVGIVFAMDFTFCNKALFTVIRGSALEWDGMLFRHPYVQYFDQLVPFVHPFDRAKVENIFYRWSKDYKRMRMLAEFYPPPAALQPKAGKKVRISSTEVNGWYGALAIYSKLIGDNWLDFADGEFAMPVMTETDKSGSQSAGSRFDSSEIGFHLSHLPVTFVGKLDGEYRAPVSEYLPARTERDGEYQFTIGPEHFCTSPRTIAIKTTKYGRVACCESVLGMLLYHWLFNNCASCCFYFGKLWELYLSESHEILLPSVDVIGNPRDTGVIEYMNTHKTFATREKPPALHFDRDSSPELNWVPQEMYRLDGHIVEGLAVEMRTNRTKSSHRGGAINVETLRELLSGPQTKKGGAREEKPIVVYGRSNCAFSMRAAKIPGAKVIMDDYRTLRALAKEFSWDTVPMIFEGEKFIGGLSDFLSKFPYLEASLQERTFSDPQPEADDEFNVPQFEREEDSSDLQEITIMGGTYSDVLDDKALEAIANSKAYIEYTTKGTLLTREAQYINTLKYFFGERFDFNSVVKVFEEYKKGTPASELRELLPLGGSQQHFPFGDKEARANRIGAQFFNELSSPEVGLEPSPDLKMLDIGSMDGLIPQSLGRLLKTTADNIFCIDVHVVGDANVTWLEYGDDWYIPLPDQSLDLVVCSQVLHHIGDFTAIDATIKKIYRLLKKDGLFLIKEHDSLLNDKSFAAFLDTIHLAYERLNMEPEYQGIHLMNKIQLDSRIRQVGFERAKDTKPRGDERIYIAIYRRV